MERLLQDRIAVVTGAGKGIGKACALTLAEQGATVYAVARSAADLDALAAQAAELAGAIRPRPGDVTDEAFVQALFAGLDRECGRLDILVNNAGIAPGGSIFDADPATFKACLDLNIWAVFLCTQQACRLMRPAGRGKIVCIGSVRSHWTEGGSAGAYNASKYGVRGFVESVARELHGSGLNIAVSLLCPGAVDTPLTNPQGLPQTNWLRPEDISRAMLHAVTAPDGVNVFDTIVIPMAQRPW